MNEGPGEDSRQQQRHQNAEERTMEKKTIAEIMMLRRNSIIDKMEFLKEI